MTYKYKTISTYENPIKENEINDLGKQAWWLSSCVVHTFETVDGGDVPRYDYVFVQMVE